MSPFSEASESQVKFDLQLNGADTAANIRNTEPIAVCGIALRLPGGVATPSQFWDLLVNKQDARGLVPESRFNVSSYYSKSGKPGRMKTQYGYFLDDSVDVGALDTSFFRMPRSEVERVDPQQRLLLELTRECLDSAGEVDYRGKPIGTYIGAFGEDWLESFAKDNEIVGQYKITGYGEFLLSNRISYEYDLQGPSMTIRTACSSALIGLHQACLSIQSGECSAALVGGSNLILAPGTFVSMSEQGVLSPTGSCRTFDADADGYARAEAVNLVYIKKLSDALRDGNPIRAIIRGTSSNADGKTPSLTMPSFDSHEAMIRRAYEAAGISNISETAFVECHGTGTATGDPIETKTIGTVFGDAGVFIGACKPNIGHSEGASGITSLIKGILTLEHRHIPPNIKFNKPNPGIPFKEKNLRVPLELTPWPADRMERVSINSFGIGGANAHVVLESAASFLGKRVDLSIRTAPESSHLAHLVLFSANSTDSLRRQAVNTRKYLDENPHSLPDVAYTLACRRIHLPQRAFSVLGEGIEPNVSSFVKLQGSAVDLVLVFTGQGAQWPRMGIELFGVSPVFAKSIDLMNTVLKSLSDGPSWSIIDELMRSDTDSRVYEAAIAQPLCTAIQVALVDALTSFGVRPFAVIGHSSGEMAAAYAAGKISRQDAIIAAYYRGQVSAQATRPGSMGAVGMGWADTEPFLVPGVVIACENSPSSVTISGDKRQVGEVLAAIKQTKPDVLVRPLKVDKAYHSHHMQEVGENYLRLMKNKIQAVEQVSASSPIFFSSVTGKQVDQHDSMDADYWRLNLESPVLFGLATSNLVTYHKTQSANCLAILEVGPHAALSGPLRQILAQKAISYQYTSCLRRLEDARQTFMTAIGQLWQHGLSIDFARLTNPKGIARVVPDLPTYPWQHDHSYLFASRTIQEWRFRKFRKHELLGVKVPESSEREPVFRNVLCLNHVSWLRDHNIKGDAIFPCAGYIGMAGEAARQLCNGEFTGFAVRDVVIDMAMILTETNSVEIITSLRKERLTDSLESAWWEFTISSHNGSTWAKHCTGHVRSLSTPGSGNEPQNGDNLHRNVIVSKWYQALRSVGANYGPCFQGLDSVSCSTTEHTAQGMALHTVSDDEEFYPIHPTKIDFFLQLFSVASSKGVAQQLDTMTVPTSIGFLEIFNCSDEIKIDVNATKTQRNLVCGSGKGFDGAGRLVMSMTSGKLSPLDTDQADQITDPHAGARVVWQPDVDCMAMSKLVSSHADQEEILSLLQELNLFNIQTALQKLDGVKTRDTHLQAFYKWMEKQSKPSPDSDATALAQMISGTSFAPCAIAMQKVLEQIVPIFKGEIEPLEVLMPDNALVDLYNMLNLTDRKLLFQALSHSKPNMKILEIGAGTGGTTSKVLSWLKNPITGAKMYASYTYTDISGGFFTAAQERFKAYPNMIFQTLDISKNPLDQGFEAESFDLILAANVLHATPSLKSTLSNVRALLKPEGRLYMEELCCEVKPINFIMGILPGWWLGVDDGRPNEPYISPSQWDAALMGAGFGGLEDFALDCPAPNHLLAFMVARPKTDLYRQRAITLLYDEASKMIKEELKALLASQGYDVSLTTLEQGFVGGDRDVIALIDIVTPFFDHMGQESFAVFQDIVRRLSKSKVGLFWVTRSSQVRCQDPRWAQTIGTSRCIRSELSMDFATCEVNDPSLPNLVSVVRIFQKFQARAERDSVQPDFEYAITNGVVQIPRLYPVNVINEIAGHPGSVENESCDLIIEKYGRLNSLKWAERPKVNLMKDEIAVEAKAVGMNFKDVLIAMGIVESPEKTLGLEAAGVVQAVGPEVQSLRPGDRVIVFGGGCFSTRIVITEKLCARIPDSLNFEDAATMPCVFSTVIYGLLDIGRLASGQSVLIHSACGGVGLAAIQICKLAGAKIFCTVGSQDKVRYLESTWGIPNDRIFNSRDSSFLDGVLKATDGQGVDLVLNSLSGELLHASWSCVAEFGKMIELGKRDLIGNGKLAMNIFELNRSYHGVDLGHLINLKPAEGNRLLRKLVELLEQGHIKPIRPIKTFTADAAEECFRYMQKGQHMGKIVVSMNMTNSDLSAVRTATGPMLHRDASYLLVGGLGGLGKLVSNWMIEHGAKSLIYLSRRAGESADDQTFFKELESQSCTVTVVKGSVTNMRDVEQALAQAKNPIRGIFNMSMVLRDQGFAKMTYDEWTKAVQPKVQGTWNLHRACVASNIDLDHFILFSSLSGIIGQRGQANYAGANTFLDAFVQYRQNLGLPAAVINIGALLDHGYVAESPELMEAMRTQGFYGIKTPQLLDSIAAVMLSSAPLEKRSVVFVNPSQLVIGLRSVTSLSDPSNRVVWKTDRRMLLYFNDEPVSMTAKTTSATSSKLVSFLSRARLAPAELQSPEASVFLAQQIYLQLFRLLLKPADNEEDIDVDVSLQDAGLDSLVAVEMRSWWKSVFPFDISVLEMLSMRTLLALGERAAQGLRETFVPQVEDGVTDGEKHDTEGYIRTKMP